MAMEKARHKGLNRLKISDFVEFIATATWRIGGHAIPVILRNSGNFEILFLLPVTPLGERLLLSSDNGVLDLEICAIRVRAPSIVAGDHPTALVGAAEVYQALARATPRLTARKAPPRGRR